METGKHSNYNWVWNSLLENRALSVWHAVPDTTEVTSGKLHWFSYGKERVLAKEPFLVIQIECGGPQATERVSFSEILIAQKSQKTHLVAKAIIVQKILETKHKIGEKLKNKRFRLARRPSDVFFKLVQRANLKWDISDSNWNFTLSFASSFMGCHRPSTSCRQMETFSLQLLTPVHVKSNTSPSERMIFLRRNLNSRSLCVETDGSPIFRCPLQLCNPSATIRWQS